MTPLTATTITIDLKHGTFAMVMAGSPPAEAISRTTGPPDPSRCDCTFRFATSGAHCKAYKVLRVGGMVGERPYL